MALYAGTVTYSYHGTITAGSVDKINFDTGFHSFGVVNYGTSTLYIRPSAVGTAVPVAKADNTYDIPALPANLQARRYIFTLKDQSTYIQAISGAAVEYTVEGYR